ncbi:hypothetical protein GP486_003493 [Trichoglossum hirsutum]|uniref:Uncharacterized protein n=1 Tax=Trichoglossum hirsutum TaxID=265104 RepID=A0A9P8RQK8_9PEZI|nr:hypothetical protein GP486_003493 [Trichoglossum hirsutum]
MDLTIIFGDGSKEKRLCLHNAIPDSSRPLSSSDTLPVHSVLKQEKLTLIIQRQTDPAKYFDTYKWSEGKGNKRQICQLKEHEKRDLTRLANMIEKSRCALNDIQDEPSLFRNESPLSLQQLNQLIEDKSGDSTKGYIARLVILSVISDIDEKYRDVYRYRKENN